MNKDNKNVSKQNIENKIENAVNQAHKEAEKDIENDPDLQADPIDDLDEGELARLEDEK